MASRGKNYNVRLTACKYKFPTLTLEVGDMIETYDIIIRPIIKYIYIAQDREEAVNAPGNGYKWNRNVLNCFWTSPVWYLVYAVQQEECFTPEVLGRRTCGRRSLFSCVEQSSAAVSGCVLSISWEVYGTAIRIICYPDVTRRDNKFRVRYDLRKYYFINTVVNLWHYLPMHKCKLF